jgi:hypothetical protein
VIVRQFLARPQLTSLRYKVVMCQTTVRQCLAKKAVETLGYVKGDPDAALIVAYMIT